MLPWQPGMVIRDYQDLVAWQLADELKQKVYELIETSSARTDFRFRDQMMASAASAPANIAEGFAYYRHPEFARHVRIARAEITETLHHLGDGVQRGHWNAERALASEQLARRARGAATGLLRHLMTTKAPDCWPSG
jgi:four helix bundle protein